MEGIQRRKEKGRGQKGEGEGRKERVRDLPDFFLRTCNSCKSVPEITTL